MTKIIFITSGKIEYRFPGLSLYESIKLTAKGERFPNISETGITDIIKVAGKLRDEKVAAIYTASTAQCLDTAKVISKKLGKEIIISNNLVPLRFDLEKIISKAEFNTDTVSGFNILRNRYLDSFYNDALLDSNREIKHRFEEFIREISDNHENRNVIAVSHAYLIRLFETYNELGERMYSEKILLNNKFKPEQEPMHRLETLALKI